MPLALLSHKECQKLACALEMMKLEREQEKHKKDKKNAEALAEQLPTSLRRAS